MLPSDDLSIEKKKAVNEDRPISIDIRHFLFLLSDLFANQFSCHFGTVWKNHQLIVAVYEYYEMKYFI